MGLWVEEGNKDLRIEWPISREDSILSRDIVLLITIIHRQTISMVVVKGMLTIAIADIQILGMDQVVVDMRTQAMGPVGIAIQDLVDIVM